MDSQHDTLDDVSALAWVQEELRKSLEAAHKALRRTLKDTESTFGSDLDDVEPALLRNARQHLHQGVGVLELVGLPAAATLLRASESLVQRYIAKPHKLDPAAVDAIEHASFALLDFLARRLAGKPVSPLALFPQYRAVQELAGAERVHPADLWPQDWQWAAMPAPPDVLPRHVDGATVAEFEGEVLTLMRKPSPEVTRRLAALSAELAAGAAQASGGEHASTLWQLAAAFFEAQSVGLLEADVYTKRLTSRLLAQLRSQLRGETAAPERLAEDLSFFCAQAAEPDELRTAPRLSAVHRAYPLTRDTLPADYGRSDLGRFDPSLIVQARKRVASAKDSWSAVAGGEMHRLNGLIEQFSLVADSLKRLVPGGERLGEALSQAVTQTVHGGVAPPPALAMEVATSVLYVEAALEDNAFDQPDQAARVQRLAERIGAVQGGAAPEALEPWMEELYRRVSDRQTMGSVVQELRAALSESEKLIDQFFRAPAEPTALIPVPAQLQAMRGVLSVLGLDQASHAVLRMRDDVDALVAAGAEARHQQPLFERLAGNLGALSFLIDLLGVQPQAAKSLFRFDADSGLLVSQLVRRETPLEAAAATRLEPALIAQAQELAAGASAAMPLAELSFELDRLSQAPEVTAQPALAASLSNAQALLGQAEAAGATAPPEAAVREQVAGALADFLSTASDPVGLEAGAPVSAPLPLISLAPSAPVEATGLEGDDEMLEVFLEEAREVLDTARGALAELHAAADDVEQLTTVRRAFHTLKGSSRMVGLKDFGEAGWAGEQLYNAWLASQRPASEELLGLTGELLAYLSGWVGAIAAGDAAAWRSEPVRRAADALRLDGRRLPVRADAGSTVAVAGAAAAAGVPASASPETVDVVAPAAEPAAGSGSPAVPEAQEPAPVAEAPVAVEVPDLAAPDVEPEAPAPAGIAAPAEAAGPVDLASVLPFGFTLPSASDLDLVAPDEPTLPAGGEPPPSEAAEVPGLDFSFDLGEPAEPARAESADAGVLPPAGAPAAPIESAESTGQTIEPTLEGLETIESVEGIEPVSSGFGVEPTLPLPLDRGPDEDAIITTLDVELPLEPGFVLQPPGVIEPLAPSGPPEEQAPSGPAAEDAAGPAGAEPSQPAPTDALPGPLAPFAPPDQGAPLPPLAVGPDEANAAEALPVAANDAAAPGAAQDEAFHDDQVKRVGPLRISIPLFNIFLNEADELSRRLGTELSEWALELHRPVGETAVTLAHSLAGSSATVGFADLSALARQLEHALMRSQSLGSGTPEDARLFGGVADEIRRLLHQFAAGFLRAPPAGLIEQLAERERVLVQRLEARGAAAAPRDAELAAAQAAEAAEPEAAASASEGDELPAAGWAESEEAAMPAPGAELDQEPEQGPEAVAEAPPAAEPATEPGPPEAEDSRLGGASGFAELGQAEFKPFVPLHEEPARPAPALALDGDDDIDQVDAVDLDLFGFFEEEAEDLLPALAAHLRDWLGEPARTAHASAAMRTLHTLKGGARLAGAMRLGEHAHRLETAIEHTLAREVAEAADVEALLVRADALSAAFETLRQRDAQAYQAAQAAAEASAAAAAPAPLELLPLPPLEPPIEAPGEALAGAHAPAEPAPEEAAEPAPGQGAAGIGIDWSRFAAAPAAPLAPAERAPLPSTAAVRVRSQLLDRMVNQAGEVSIRRARLEAEVAQMRSSLADLGENLERLRQQLRDIELQAETQMGTRMEAAKAAAENFDPLEFDRYTRFQELTRMMAESVNDVATVQRSLQRTLETAEDELAAQARVARELQDDLLRTRMVEFEGLSERLYRVVRQAAKETGKQVRLDILGGSIEVDRGVLERMTGAFEHLLRNCVTHGIEAPAARAAAGKDPTGGIVVSLHQEGNEVAIEFRDDGAGLDLARIRDKGVAAGLIDAQGAHSDAELANLIFTPGFSTAESVTELAGRGIGMDVVRAEVNALGGRIETASARGQGSSFKLVLPLTTAVTQVVMLRCGSTTVAVPSTLVEIVRRASAAEVEAAYESGAFVHGEQTLPFFWLGALLQASPRSAEAGARMLPVVVIRSAQQRVVLHVDEVLGNHEVVVKNLGPQLSRLPGLAGMTLLASGAVALIYNPVALATVYAEAARRATAAALQAPRAQPAPELVQAAPAAGAAPATPLVLVVDDSLTVRRVTQRLLVREGYRVALAKDGLEALERVAEERPTVVLSDIEMPRMDGFDLVRNLRGDAALASLPVIMITSRIAQKHRDYASELGVDHYLGKPYGEEELLSLIGRYCAAQAATD